MVQTGELIVAIALPAWCVLALTVIARRVTRWELRRALRHGLRWGAYCFLMVGGVELVGGQPVAANAASIGAVVAAVLCWLLGRRRRDRARRELGAKSRATIATLVASLRERLRPRPVLKPAPVPQ